MRRRRRQRKRRLKSEFAFFQPSWRLLQLNNFFKCTCMRTLLHLLRVLSKFRRKFRRCLFTSSIKWEIWHVVFLPWRSRNGPNSVLRVQSCVLITLTFLLPSPSSGLKVPNIRDQTRLLKIIWAVLYKRSLLFKGIIILLSVHWHWSNFWCECGGFYLISLDEVCNRW